jgi:hypothetical protein
VGSSGLGELLGLQRVNTIVKSQATHILIMLEETRHNTKIKYLLQHYRICSAHSIAHESNIFWLETKHLKIDLRVESARLL